MSRRSDRVANLIRNVVGELLLTKVSDPRIEPARTSVTRVEVPEDLLSAKVYVSVIGTEGEQRRTLTALCHAAGHIQELMMRQISLRNTPALAFLPDTRFKKTLETYAIIDKAMEELRQKDKDAGEEPPQAEGGPGPGQTPEKEASS